MATIKLGRNDPCSCGSGRKFKQCCLVATPVEAQLQPPPLEPRLAQQLMAGFACLQGRRFDEAETIGMAVLGQRPSAPDALHLLGLVEYGRGRPEVALVHIERALAQGGNFSMHSSRGRVLTALGQHADAVESHRRALAAGQDSVPLLINLASALHALQAWEECTQLHRRALLLMPSSADAHNGLGFALQMLGDSCLAEQHYRQALMLSPRNVNALTNLGNMTWARGDAEQAFELYEAAVQADPQNLLALGNWGVALQSRGRADEALAVFERSYALQPSLERRIKRDLLLPVICESREQMLKWRNRFEAGLDALMLEVDTFPEPTPQVFCTSAFLLAFHGEDDLPLMRKLAAMYLKLCPALDYSAQHLDRAAEARVDKVRIGFFSTNVQDHSVSRCFAGLVNQLAEDRRFDVVLLSPQPVQGVGPNLYADFGGRFVQLDRRYRPARDVIEAQALDMLIYQDIGMDELGYFLAFSRLARIQCVLGGHPVTTGIPNVDHFISTALAEAPDAQRHYSERLQLIADLPVVYRHPELPVVLKGRAEFGLPQTGSLYICPMMLQKLHPDFDQAIDEILTRDPHGFVVLFMHSNSRWEDQLHARFAGSISPGSRPRILFLPWLKDYADFISVNALADVVLDPFHFGIGSTVIATFAVGTPIVTRPSPYLRGRAALAYTTLIEVSQECVADSLEAYVERALAFAHDGELNRSVRAKIMANKHRLFDNEAPVGQLAELLAQLAAFAA